MNKRKKYNRRSYVGENNPFYGKKHTEEVIQKLREYNQNNQTGENNPFYGKKHSQDSLDKMKKSNEIYYASEQFKKLCFEKTGLNIEKLKEILEDYIKNKVNKKYIQEKYKIDFRTLEKYFYRFNLIENDEQYKLLKKKKQRSISNTEDFIYLKLIDIFGNENVQRQYRISYYKYDFIIFDKFLIEFDGIYWHSFDISKKRDEIKNLLAKHHNLILFRINEIISKNYSYDKELEEIKNKIYEIQIEKN